MATTKKKLNYCVYNASMPFYDETMRTEKKNKKILI